MPQRHPNCLVPENATPVGARPIFLASLLLVAVLSPREAAGVEAPVDKTGSSTDPIPGSSMCRGCITGFNVFSKDDETYVDMCVDTSAKYIGTQVPTADDVPIVDLLTGGSKTTARWEMRVAGTKAENSVCASGYPKKECKATLCGPGQCSMKMKAGSPGSYMVYRVPLAWDPPDMPDKLRIVFSEIDGHVFSPQMEATAYPMIEVEKNSNECGGLDSQVSAGSSSSGATVPDSLLDYAAYIAYPSPHGGLRTCSGILVAPDKVLTAAHCFVDTRAVLGAKNGDQMPELNEITVIVGGKEPIAGDGRRRRVAKYVWSDKFNKQTLEHDLAVITLGQEVEIPLAARRVFDLGPSPPDATCTIHALGFGVDSKGAYTRERSKSGYDHGYRKHFELQEVPPDQKCGLVGSVCKFDPTLFVRLKSQSNGLQLCRGDSGGAVIKRCENANKTSYHLVGVTSARVPEVATKDQLAKMETGQGRPKGSEVLQAGQSGQQGGPNPPLDVNSVTTLQSGRTLASATSGISFNHGNDCGIPNVGGFLAAKISEQGQVWLQGQLKSSPNRFLRFQKQ